MANSLIEVDNNAHEYAEAFAIACLNLEDVLFTGQCPVQGYGKTQCGLDFYFRARGSTARLSVYPVINGEEGDTIAESSIKAFAPWDAGWIGSGANDRTQIAYVFYTLWQDIKQQLED